MLAFVCTSLGHRRRVAGAYFFWRLYAVYQFVLVYFGTANIIPSTLSVTTSFAAVYLTFRRSPYFAVAYAANDLILIALWVYASLSDTTYISVVICFLVFFVNDIYGFFSWKKMQKRQKNV